MSWLKVITGPMFSGKSKVLIHDAEDMLEVNPKSVVIFKPKIDTRTTNYISSRAGLRLPATAVETGELVESCVFYGEDDVFVDEVQFFGPDIVTAIEDLLKRGKRVTVAGLDRDFRGRAFGSMAELLVMADEVVKLTTDCRYKGACDRRATMTHRANVTAGEAIVVVGDADIYEARCRPHHGVA